MSDVLYVDHIFDITVFRPLPRRVVQHEPLNIWYLDDEQILLVVHPLGISYVNVFYCNLFINCVPSWVSTYPRRLMYAIPLQDTRTL